MKKLLMSTLIAGVVLGTAFHANAFMHYRFWSFAVFDYSGAIARGITAATKAFLEKDTETIAELVWKGSSNGGGCGGAGGAGGVYGGDPKVDASLALSVLTSPITSISEKIIDAVLGTMTAYPANVTVKEAQVCDLALKRIEVIVQEISSIGQLDTEKWGIQYRSQQRSIQAMANALTMKKAYAQLGSIAESSSGGYGDYSEAVSTVAGKRLLLDALMVLRKQVIAARVRARAETMEVDMEDLPTAPTLECLPSFSNNPDSESEGALPGTKKETGTTEEASSNESAKNVLSDEDETQTPIDVNAMINKASQGDVSEFQNEMDQMKADADAAAKELDEDPDVKNFYNNLGL